MARRKRTGDKLVDSWIEEIQRKVSVELKEVLTSTPYNHGVGVDTGALRDSIDIEKDGDDITVGVNTGKLVSDPRNKRARMYAGYHHEHYNYLDVAVDIVGGRE